MEELLLSPEGSLRILPYADLANVPQEHISQFCVQHGVYCLPTQELVEWLRAELAGQKAIEIGSGNGALARALSITATDSYMQADPKIAALYAVQGQAPVHYGLNVEKWDAAAAVRLHRPHTVVACWVTHLYNEAEEWRAGNMFGVDEGQLLARVQKYIFVGNELTHALKPILDRPHRVFKAPWLLSRSINRDMNVIWVWES